MCVRDLPRGKCRVSRKTSTAKLRKSENVALSRSSIKRARRMKREEEIDLFCTELLAQGDHNTYQSDDSHLKIDGEPLSPLIVDIPSALCGVGEPSLYSLFLMSPADCNYFQQRTWTGVERVLSPIGYAEEIAVDVGTGDYRAGDDRCWSEPGLLDTVVWHDFSPEHFSLPVATYDLWECVEAEPYLPFFGNSLQSNSFPCEQRATKIFGPFRNDKERRSTESVASSRSRENLEFHVSAETFNNVISTKYHQMARNTSDSERKGNTGSSLCTVEFQEVMEFLLEKESITDYQLSEAYVEKLRGNSEIHDIRSIRRHFVKWILKVVEHLQLSLLTAARAVSFFDRILSQRLSVDAQVEVSDELLLAATACVWIAAKLEDSSVPHLSCIQGLVTVGFDIVKFRKIEVTVLSSLGWRTIGTTASDFLANMMARLPVLGVPGHILTCLGFRSEEIMRILLPEVEFLAYQPSVVSFSVMQCLLDEYVPVQTASLMAAFHLALAVNLELTEDCTRAIKKYMKQTQAPISPSTTRRCVEFKKRNDVHSDSSNVDSLREHTTRLPISAF